MKAVNIIITAAIMICCLWGTTAWGTPVTIPYEFVQDESIVARSGRPPRIYSIEGRFVLNVDFDVGIASFNQVNAKLSSEIEFYDYYKKEIMFTDDLNVLFNMTELVSTSVTDAKIDFLFEKNIPLFPASDVHLTVMFMNNSLQMTGYFGEPVADGYWYSLDAVAVPEPATLLILVVGGIILRKRN